MEYYLFIHFPVNQMSHFSDDGALQSHPVENYYIGERCGAVWQRGQMAQNSEWGMLKWKWGGKIYWIFDAIKAEMEFSFEIK